MDLGSALRIAASGMKVQAARLRVTAENLANAQSTGSSPGADPFRRKTMSVKEQAERGSDVRLVDIDRIGTDRRPFELRYEPGHPAADAQGYVKYPNVNPLLELTDMREAQRTYEANLTALQVARQLLGKTLDLLR
jgi:flagellar basal-body rod protein FlgC